MVTAIGAFDGEHFSVIPCGLPQRCTPDAAEGMRYVVTPQHCKTRSTTQVAPLCYQLHLFRVSGHRNLCWARQRETRENAEFEVYLYRPVPIAVVRGLGAEA